MLQSQGNKFAGPQAYTVFDVLPGNFRQLCCLSLAHLQGTDSYCKSGTWEMVVKFIYQGLESSSHLPCFIAREACNFRGPYSRGTAVQVLSQALSSFIADPLTVQGVTSDRSKH